MAAALSQDGRPTYEELEAEVKGRRDQCHDLRNVMAVNVSGIDLAIKYLEKGQTADALAVLQRSKVRTRETLAKYEKKRGTEE